MFFICIFGLCLHNIMKKTRVEIPCTYHRFFKQVDDGESNLELCALYTHEGTLFKLMRALLYATLNANFGPLLVTE